MLKELGRVVYKFVSGEGPEAGDAALSVKCHLYVPHLAAKSDRLQGLG